MVWGRRFLTLLTWKCASRHIGVQFFISHLASWLGTRRPSRAPNHWKNTVNRDLPTFSRTCIFLLPTLSLLWSSHFLTSPPWLFPPLLFHLCILSEVWLLNFLRSFCYHYTMLLSNNQYYYDYHCYHYHDYLSSLSLTAFLLSLSSLLYHYCYVR